MLDYKIFKKVTRNDNGNIIGLRIDLPPQNQYRDEVRHLRMKFNDFTLQLLQDHWSLYNVDNNWQNSGYFKQYFWNQIKHTDYYIEGISLWIGIREDGIRIQFGTTDKYLFDDREAINKEIYEKFQHLNFEKFQQTNEWGYLNFLYIGENCHEDIDNFRNTLAVLCEKYIEYIKEKTKDIEMLDYEGYREYLLKIGIETPSTWMAYVSQNKLEILNNIPGYQDKSDIEKVLKFSNESTDFRTTFDAYHNFANETTFNDLRSGARRYKYYLQYKALLDIMHKYENDPNDFELNGAHVFFSIFGQPKRYPVKAICRKIYPKLELENDFTTNQAKVALDRIFNKQSIINIEYFNLNVAEQPSYLEVKNIILYGPPGVGKTHNYKKLILLIEEGKKQTDIFSSIQDNEYFDQSDNSFSKVVDKNRVGFITFHQSFGYEDFIEGFRPNENGNIKLRGGIFKTICEDAKQRRDKNFYLVIDEINRGNISKIFGELITLIEEDKRDMLSIILPYSQKDFQIPSNLYIIGTMNSTDKSIALIDIALRRRFTFVKLSPNQNLVPDIAKPTFENLNQYIKTTLGEDYQIGHSYFMKIKTKEDLEFVCKYKIAPLLEEYFYGDNRLKEALRHLPTFNAIEENEHTE